MKRSLLLFSAAVLAASVAAASDTGFGGAFFGYNWVRFSPNTSIPGASDLGSFNLNGGNIQLT